MEHDGRGSQVREISVGCFVGLSLSTGDTYQGVVHSMDAKRGCLTLAKATCLNTDSKHAGLLNFHRSDISSLTVLKVAKGKSREPKEVTQAKCESVNDLSTHLEREDGMDVDKVVTPRPQVSTESLVAREPESCVLPEYDERVSSTASVISDMYVVIDDINDIFYLSVDGIKRCSVIGVAMEGIDLGRNGKLCWLQIGIEGYVLLFDIIKLGSRAFSEGLKVIFEDANIQKVIHDCRSVSDLLLHRYETRLVNVFDTQVADVNVYMSNNRNNLPNGVNSLISCLAEHLDFTVEQIYSYTVKAKRMADGKAWAVRPMSEADLELAVLDVVYLRNLRTRMLELMLAEFTDGCDVYVSLLRDASNEDAKKLRTQMHIVPPEFSNLAWQARESRRRTLEHFRRRHPELIGECGGTQSKADFNPIVDDIPRCKPTSGSTQPSQVQTTPPTSQPTLDDLPTLSPSNCIADTRLSSPCLTVNSDVMGTVVAAGYEPTWLLESVAKPVKKKNGSGEVGSFVSAGYGGDVLVDSSYDSGSSSYSEHEQFIQRASRHSEQDEHLRKDTGRVSAVSDGCQNVPKGRVNIHSDSGFLSSPPGRTYESEEFEGRDCGDRLPDVTTETVAAVSPRAKEDAGNDLGASTRSGLPRGVGRGQAIQLALERITISNKL